MERAENSAEGRRRLSTQDLLEAQPGEESTQESDTGLRDTQEPK
jgi:hypothetical protein